jgi:hypothetical protein
MPRRAALTACSCCSCEHSPRPCPWLHRVPVPGFLTVCLAPGADCRVQLPRQLACSLGCHAHAVVAGFWALYEAIFGGFVQLWAI